MHFTTIISLQQNSTTNCSEVADRYQDDTGVKIIVKLELTVVTVLSIELNKFISHV